MYGDLINVVIIFVLGLYVFYKNPQNKINVAFLFFCIPAIVWDLTDYLMTVSRSYSEAYFWSVTSCIIPLNIVVIYIFILVFTENSQKLKSTFSVFFVYFGSFALTIVELISLILYPNLKQVNGIWQMGAGQSDFSFWVDTVMSTWGFVIIFLFFFYAVRFYRSTYDPLRKKQIIFIILAEAITLIFDIWLFVTWMIGTKPPDMIISSVALATMVFAYAIVKYDMFAVNTSSASETIINTMSDAVLLLNNNWRVVHANDAASAIFKKSHHELIGVRVDNLIYIIKGALIRFEINRLLKIDNKIADKEASIGLGGTVIPISFSASFIYGPDKVIRGVVVIVRDITKRKEQEDRLLHSNKTIRLANKQINADVEKLNAILTSIGEAMIVVNKENKVTRFNSNARRILKFSEDAILDASFFAIFMIEKEKGEPVNLLNEVKNKIKEGKTVKYSLNDFVYLKITDKVRVPISFVISPIILNREYLGFIVTFNNISKEMEIDKAKSEFVSLTAHQLGTPLTAIKWNLELLQSSFAPEQKKADAKKLELIGTSRKEVENMIELVEQFLNVSRIELNKLTIHPELIDLKHLLEDVVKEQQPAYELKSIKLTEKCVGQDLTLNTDKRLLRAVLQNLISNAIKYTPENGSVHLALHKVGEYFEFNVSDTGIGIPADQLNKVFSKMFRATNATMSGIDGNGLGLYLVKQIVNLSGGDIDLESEEGKGTSITVRLPISGMIQKVESIPLN